LFRGEESSISSETLLKIKGKILYVPDELCNTLKNLCRSR